MKSVAKKNKNEFSTLKRKITIARKNKLENKRLELRDMFSNMKKVIDIDIDTLTSEVSDGFLKYCIKVTTPAGLISFDISVKFNLNLKNNKVNIYLDKYLFSDINYIIDNYIGNHINPNRLYIPFITRKIFEILYNDLSNNGAKISLYTPNLIEWPFEDDNLFTVHIKSVYPFIQFSKKMEYLVRYENSHGGFKFKETINITLGSITSDKQIKDPVQSFIKSKFSKNNIETNKESSSFTLIGKHKELGTFLEDIIGTNQGKYNISSIYNFNIIDSKLRNYCYKLYKDKSISLINAYFSNLDQEHLYIIPVNIASGYSNEKVDVFNILPSIDKAFNRLSLFSKEKKTKIIEEILPDSVISFNESLI